MRNVSTFQNVWQVECQYDSGKHVSTLVAANTIKEVVDIVEEHFSTESHCITEIRAVDMELLLLTD